MAVTAGLDAFAGMAYLVVMRAAPTARRPPSSPSPRFGRAPDVLTGLRVVLGPAFWIVLPRSALAALAIAAVAACTDFFDGRLARRLGAVSPHGPAFDVVADAVFVLVALASLARTGVIFWVLPLATALSLAGFASAWRAAGPPSVVRQRGLADRAGHAAGIVNYAIVIGGAGCLAFGLPLPMRALSVVAAALNVLPLVLRAVR